MLFSDCYTFLLVFDFRAATRSIATSPGWDASPSQVTGHHFCQLALTICQYPFG